MPVHMCCMYSCVWRPKDSLRCSSPEAEERCLKGLALAWNLPTDWPVVPRDPPVSAFRWAEIASVCRQFWLSHMGPGTRMKHITVPTICLQARELVF